MNSWLIASTVLLFTIGEISCVYGFFRDNRPAGILGFVLMVYFTVMALTYKPTPTALDVYQGKTDLEYIYKDGRVTDSVVVFKNVLYCP